jgi:hypothetical protein
MQRLVWGLLILVLVPLQSSAQTARDSWDNLKQLQPGQKIEVVGTSMKSLRGPFVSVSEEAITLQVGKSQESIERAKVVRVSVRDTSHRTRNMLLGAAIAGGAALTVGLLANGPASNEGNGCAGCVAGLAAAAAGGGAGLGAIPGSRTVYRAEKQRNRPQP